MLGYDYLKFARSTPMTLGELPVGADFIVFPDDGDDSGHGGFRGGFRLYRKIEPRWPGEPWNKDCRWTCHRYGCVDDLSTLRLDMPVIQIFGARGN